MFSYHLHHYNSSPVRDTYKTSIFVLLNDSQTYTSTPFIFLISVSVLNSLTYLPPLHIILLLTLSSVKPLTLSLIFLDQLCVIIQTLRMICMFIVPVHPTIQMCRTNVPSPTPTFIFFYTYSIDISSITSS